MALKSGIREYPFTFIIGMLVAVVGSILIQFVILPHVFPSLHAGHGLLKGGDWVRFHEIAANMATAIQERGWQAWELRPEGQAPAGLAAIMYVFTGVREPYVIIPVNAVVFGVATAELYKIVRATTHSGFSWIGILPLVLFPSTVMIYGQIHKDLYSIAGLLMIGNTLPGVIRCGMKGQAKLAFRMAIGMALVWVVRPYLIQVVLFAWWVAVSIVIVSMRKGVTREVMLSLAVLVIVQLLMIELFQGTSQGTSQALLCGDRNIVERYVCKINAARIGFVTTYPDAGSNIDQNIRFENIADILAYIPRSIEIGLLAPFPDQWFEKGVSPGAKIMRRMSGLEMLVGYVGMLLIGMALFRAEGTEQVLIIAVLGYCLSIIVVQALAIPNVGTLYRMRLGPWHVIVGMGYAWGMALIAEKWRAKKAK